MTSTPAATAVFVPSTDPHPLQIEVMRQQSYPGSEIVFEQTLEPGANYARYVVSYRSDDYKIYALMTVPSGQKPATGWPVIVFNHGYIPPTQYRTTERYLAYVDAIARAGYIVFKSDYRGHGSSEGSTSGGGYGSPGYTVDILNAVASLKAYHDADANRIGMWGHSMGGQVTLRAMVVSQDIKAGVIWGGVVAPYPDTFARGNTVRPGVTPRPTSTFGPYGRRWQSELTAKYGTVAQNPAFWASISPNSYLADLSGPIQLNHSTTDEEVPVASSKTLFAQLQAAGLPAELYTYAGDNHNISANFNTAMQRSIAWFDKYVKGG
jgi:dipeptidyl aminopeptidase/acylaminoacyl peptidase